MRAQPCRLIRTSLLALWAIGAVSVVAGHATSPSAGGSTDDHGGAGHDSRGDDDRRAIDDDRGLDDDRRDDDDGSRPAAPKFPTCRR